MRSLRLKGLLPIGILFTIFSFCIFLFYSLIKSNLDGLEGLLEFIFEDGILVKDLKSPLPQALLGGWSTSAAPPLKGAGILTDLITATIPKAKVYPLRITKLNIYQEGKTRNPLSQALGFYLPPASAQSYFNFEPTFQDDSAGPFCYLWPNVLAFQAIPGQRFWIADAFASDNLNLTPCKLKGFFYPRRSDIFLKLPVLFLDEKSLSKACFKSFLEFDEAQTLTDSSYEKDIKPPEIVSLVKKKPLSPEYLFSLPLTAKDLSNPVISPNYLYIELSSSAISQAVDMLNNHFRKESLSLEAFSLKPGLSLKNLPPQTQQLTIAFIVFFALLILLANWKITPFPRNPHQVEPGTLGRLWASILGHIFFLALGWGLGGSSLSAVFLVLVGDKLKDLFSLALGFGLAKAWPFPEAFVLVFLSSFLFALGSPWQALRRSRALVVKTKPQAET